MRNQARNISHMSIYTHSDGEGSGLLRAQPHYPDIAPSMERALTDPNPQRKDKHRKAYMS